MKKKIFTVVIVVDIFKVDDGDGTEPSSLDHVASQAPLLSVRGPGHGQETQQAELISRPIPVASDTSKEASDMSYALPPVATLS